MPKQTNFINVECIHPDEDCIYKIPDGDVNGRGYGWEYDVNYFCGKLMSNQINSCLQLKKKVSEDAR